jgi:hypothetical protein
MYARKTLLDVRCVLCRVTVAVGCGLAWAFREMISPYGKPKIKQHGA